MSSLPVPTSKSVAAVQAAGRLALNYEGARPRARPRWYIVKQIISQNEYPPAFAASVPRDARTRPVSEEACAANESKNVIVSSSA